MKIGAQVYTVREFCKDLTGLAESLKKVADIGYTTVQISGTCDFEADWMREQLDSSGLQCVVTHVPPKKLQEELDKVCADHKVFGCENIGLGYYNFKTKSPEEAYPEFLETYKPIAAAIREKGLRFMYHNHDAEFRKLEGKTLLRRMAEDFSPEELGFVLDTFWIQAGGADPAEYIREFAGRIPCIHLKDFAYSEEPAIAERIAAVGDGNINWQRVVAAAADSGVEYMLVEQDTCHGEDPFACLRRSYEYLKAMGLN